MRTLPARVTLRALAASALLVALSVLAVFFLTRQPRPALSPSASRATVPHRLGFVAGKAYAYDLSVRSTQRATPRPDATPIEADLDLAGALVVRCYEATGDKLRLGISFDTMTKAKLTVSGAATLADAATLRGNEALVTMDVHGKVERYELAKSAPDSFKALMPSILALLQVTLPNDASVLWESDDTTMLGRARAHYAAGEDPRRIERQHLRYSSLSGAPSTTKPELATIDSSDVLVFGDDDVLASMHVQEHVVLTTVLDAHVDAELRLTGVTSFTGAPMVSADLETHAPGERAAAGDMEHQMLRQLAGDLTMPRLELVALAHTPGARLPPGFLTSAVALLKLDPELCGGLVDIFERPGTSLASRALLLDMLASAGHPRAQAAIRDALGSAIAQNDPRAFGTLLQRVGMVPSPEPATVDFAFHTYDSAKNRDIKAASAFALGAAMGARGLDPSLARYGDRLRKDMRAARTSADRVTLLAALGNGANARDASLIASYAHDADASVRRQAALSMRRTKTPEAKNTLFGMLGDSDSGVGMAALSSISDGALGEADLGRLATMVGTPKMSGMLHESLITTVGAEMETHREQAIAVLRAIIEASGDNHTVARARMLLGQL
jgi:hypothetical protein